MDTESILSEFGDNRLCIMDPDEIAVCIFCLKDLIVDEPGTIKEVVRRKDHPDRECFYCGASISNGMTEHWCSECT